MTSEAKHRFWWISLVPVIVTLIGFFANNLVNIAVSQSFDKARQYTDGRIGQLENKLDIIIDKQQQSASDISFIRGTMESQKHVR